MNRKNPANRFLDIPEFEAFRAFDPAPRAITETDVFAIQSEATMYQITQSNQGAFDRGRQSRLTRRTAIPLAAVALVGIGTAAAATNIIDDWVASQREQNTIVVTEPLLIGPEITPYCVGDFTVVSLEVPGREPTKEQLIAATDILASIDFASVTPSAITPDGQVVDITDDPFTGFWNGLQAEFTTRLEAAGIDPTILNFTSAWGCAPDYEGAIETLELNARIDLEERDSGTPAVVVTVTDFVADN